MFQRFKTFFKEIDGSIWFYLSLLAASLFFLRFTFFIHPDTSGDFWGNVRVEFVGFCFDVLLLGLILSIFMQRDRRKQDIKRWKEEIDDFRGWDEKEAMFRIVGNVNRLNRAGITEICLEVCHLQNAIFIEANLKGSSFTEANLENASLAEANLENTNFWDVNLKGAELYNANLKGANLMGVNFENADLRLANLENAIVDKIDWLESLEKLNVEGWEDLIKKYYIEREKEILFVIKKRKNDITA